MIGIDSISLRYGKKVIFNSINATINARDRIGLVGSNGMGKSTLLKVLIGAAELDDGRVSKASFVTIGYLPQDGIVARGKTLYEEVESAFVAIQETQKQLDEAEVRLHTLETTSEEYLDLLDVIGGLEHRLADMEVHRLQSKIEKVLMGLGFGLKDMNRDCSEFSGGWQMRIALAKLLLQEPSLLLLDEPTNHLDMQSQRWLENYLRQYYGALVIISHDIAFLDELTTRTFEITLGRLYTYAGNYTFFKEESAQRKEIAARSQKTQQRKIADTEQFINRFRAKSSKAKQVQSRIKALDKIERIELEEEEASINFSFPQAITSGQVVLELKGVRKNYGSLEVFKGVNLKIERGERVAIVGVNGAGKSTLGKVLMGREPCTEGERLVGHKVAISYFAQDLTAELDPEKTALQIVEAAAAEGQARNARAVLGAFLFRGDEAFKKVKVLSGGERCRLALACLLVQRANCLILDEPTNHLDMKSKTLLQEALMSYPGTLIIVSHDRSFLDPLVNKVLELGHGGMRTFLGNVSYYLEKVENEWDVGGSKSTPSPQAPKAHPKDNRQPEAEERERKRPLMKRLDSLELSIEKLEKEKADWEERMLDPAFFEQGAASQEGIRQHERVQGELKKMMEEWAQLQEELGAS